MGLATVVLFLVAFSVAKISSPKRLTLGHFLVGRRVDGGSSSNSIRLGMDPA
jgi:hypothetical protein